jgi:hypothetical protein
MPTEVNPHLGKPLQALLALRTNRDAVLEDILLNDVPLTVPTAQLLLRDIRQLSEAIDLALKALP